MQGAGSGGPHGLDEQHSRRPFWRQPFGTGRFGRISSPSVPLCTSSTRRCPPSRTASQIASVAHARNIEIGSIQGGPQMKRWLVALTLLGSAVGLSGCGYNAIQGQDEQIKAAWSEVINQYQRRADLIPNLVNTVKGYAQQEQDVLLGVTNARAKVGTIQATPELVNDPEAFAKFQQAQGELTSALSRLLVVAENYPQLKSDQNFRDLQAQLEGTENRIT